ncbi:hypothetical protein [Nitrosomonas sp. sh817]|uniref:hypothetical protein n=1 Tax=Nitrosomonas sp. sh817 TaxID=3070658 RepID=UPI0027DE38C2|nr:hypothetical protein [Nitrosomonas sp. sh817]WMJ08421.1 hypothetical protein RBH92_13515 [Nitrosomonas sp. sh817]
MPSSPLNDVVTVVGSAYYQPIADLVQNLLRKKPGGPFPGGSGVRENGYAVSIIVLLVAMLESFTSRLRFVRNSELVAGGRSTPDLLAEYFPELPTKEDLVEVFLLRNVVVHNHIWHLDVSNYEAELRTISTPQDLGFQTNKHYADIVDVLTRRTLKLSLNVNPMAVDRRDVLTVFQVVWKTLEFMNNVDFGHTPLAGRTVGFFQKYRQFDELINELERDISSGNAP